MTPERITAAGGVMYRGDREKPEVLVIYRRGVWDLPKGKREPGETPEDCAVREVAEEVGLRNPPTVKSYLADTFHTYDEKGRHMEKQTFWYAMQGGGDEPLAPQREEDIEKLEWVQLDEAERRVAFDNLRDVLQAFRNWITFPA